MNEDHIHAIDALMAIHHQWKPNKVELELEAFDETTGEHVLQTVNLVDVIGKGSRHWKDSPNHRFYLQRSVYNTNCPATRKKIISPFIAKACALAGFLSTMKGWESDANCIRFCCSRSRRFQEQKSFRTNQVSAARKIHSGTSRDALTAEEQNAITGLSVDEIGRIDSRYVKTFSERNRKTARPLTKEETCECSFLLYWEKSADHSEHGTWFFAQNGAGKLSHSGHMKKTEFEIKRILSHHSENAKTLALAIHDVHLDSSIVNAIIQRNNGENMTPSQVRYWCRVNVSIPVSIDETVNFTVGERIFNWLLSQKDISFDLVWADPDEAGLYVTFYGKVKLKRTHVASQTRESVTEELPEGALEHPMEDVCSPEAWSCSMMNALSFMYQGRKQILVGVAFVTDDQRRMANCFPEAAGMDVQFGTNQEKRNLLIMTVKTSENRINCIFQYFMPSSARWAYNFAAMKAIPNLLGSRFCQKLSALATDGEQKMYAPFEDLMGPGKLYPNCRHFLCAYHLTYRNNNEPSTGPSKDRPHQSTWLKVFRSYVMALSTVPETEEEFDIMVRNLVTLFESDADQPFSPRHASRLGPENCKKLVAYFRKSILIHKKKIAFYERRTVRSFDLHTTSNTESEGAALKKSPMGPRPNDSLDKSAEAIAKQSRRRSANKSKRTAASLDEHIVKIKEGDEYIAELERFTEYAADHVRQQYECSAEYWVFRVDETTFWLTKKKYQQHSSNESDPGFFRYMIPNFARVRTVIITNILGRYVLQCRDCGMRERWGIGCRHEYAVLGRTPTPADIASRWQKLHLYCFQKEEFMQESKAFDAADADEVMGVRVLWPFRPGWSGNFSVENESHIRTLMEMRVRHNNLLIRPGNFWNDQDQVLVPGSVAEVVAGPDTFFGLHMTSHTSEYANTQEDYTSTQEKQATGFMDGSDSNELELVAAQNNMPAVDHLTNVPLDEAEPIRFSNGYVYQVFRDARCYLAKSAERPRDLPSSSFQMVSHFVQDLSALADTSRDIQQLIFDGLQSLTTTARMAVAQNAARGNYDRVNNENQAPWRLHDNRETDRGSQVTESY